MVRCQHKALFRAFFKNNFKDLVLRCIAQLVDSNQANIRSGWKNVFGVLGIAASSEREAIVEVRIETYAPTRPLTAKIYKKFC